MGEGRHDQSDRPQAGRRLTVQEAAAEMETTVDAIRKRVQRDTIAHEKDERGRVWIFPSPGYADRTRHDPVQDATGHRPSQGSDAERELVDGLRDQVAYLRGLLDAEREANRENRRLLAAALERIPELEAPASPETPGAPETAAEPSEGASPRSDAGGPQEATRRPWWRRIFGGGSEAR